MKITFIVGMAFFLPISPTFAQSEGEKLDSVIKTYADAQKKADAYWATYYQVEENLSNFGDYLSAENIERNRKIYEQARDQLKTIQIEALSVKEKRTYDLFKGDIETSLQGLEFPDEYIDNNQMDNRLRNYIDDTSQALSYFPFDSVKHYDDFLKRSEGFPSFIDRLITTLRNSVTQKMGLNCPAAQKMLGTFQDALEPEIEKNPFYRPVLFMPKEITDPDRARLADEYRKMVSDRILPGFKKFDAFFRNEFLPQCRSSFGIG